MEYSISWDSYSISGGTLEAITSKKSLVCSPAGGVVVSWRRWEYDYEEKYSKICPPIPEENNIFIAKDKWCQFWDLNYTLITYLSTSAQLNPSDWRSIYFWKVPPPLLYVTLFNNCISLAWPFVILPYKLCLWCNEICLISGGHTEINVADITFLSLTHRDYICEKDTWLI